MCFQAVLNWGRKNRIRTTRLLMSDPLSRSRGLLLAVDKVAAEEVLITNNTTDESPRQSSGLSLIGMRQLIQGPSRGEISHEGVRI